MPDDETPAPDAATADDRDERIAALLAVEPLDDVTRRRLVSTAIRSTGSARQARRLIAAAAVVVTLVVGAGVVVALGGSDGNDTAPSAARDKARAIVTPGGENQYSIEAGAPDLGDFGDLAVAANVDRLRTAFAAADTSSSPSAASAAGDSATRSPTRSDALESRLRALGCSPPTLPAGTVVGLASGTLGGYPVIVVDLQSSGGTHSFHAIETDTCKVHRLS
jgi:hypothetical protein